MNLGLLDSFGQSYPEDLEHRLECTSLPLTCTFNKRGTLFAVGCNDGRIVIWDFLTKGVAKTITAHTRPVCSISWSRDGQLIITASIDNSVCVFDVLTGDMLQSYRFPSPILKVQFNSRNRNRALLTLLKHAAIVLKLDEEKSFDAVPLSSDNDLNIVASFDRKGQHIYTGNSKGKVMVFKTDNLSLVASFKVSTGSTSAIAIRSIEFSRRGTCFLLNCSDRIIRVYEAGEIMACGKDGEPEPIQKLQDLVNKTMWKKCCFSGDGEFIAAGSARQHALYIWEKSVGNLVKILQGMKGDVMLDFVWHPVRPVLCSIANGIVSIWSQNQVEKWSAYAPDFKELEENVEYEERESEFDLSDEDKEGVKPKIENYEDENVDVVTEEPIEQFLSSDEEPQYEAAALHFLPICPDVDDPEDWPEGGEHSSTKENQALGEKRQILPEKENPPSKKKKKEIKNTDIDLPNAPIDELHPMLCPKKPNESGRVVQRKPAKPEKARKKERKDKSIIPLFS
ncbi:DgyrCDS11722 [Dimorphilus gyrociliatus]|uniref:DgyrCDS11722 n=1 Tax=Dimorphilus gyrociliatus TaxID=2664684 RepID=A0A7I8W4E0_9ANNE|nr:DgyrCDS11722 [Dimorphilus gyrociliatus]